MSETEKVQMTQIRDAGGRVKASLTRLESTFYEISTQNQISLCLSGLDDLLKEFERLDSTLSLEESELQKFEERYINLNAKYNDKNEMNEMLRIKGQTRRSDIYCQQLDRLKLVTDQKWPKLAKKRGVVFHQDNVTPHTFVVTCQKLWELGWKMLMHTQYCLDLAAKGNHLCLALQNFQTDKKLGSRVDCEN
ncbi:histone-lysine N-methyltransferase SETMAR [Trichonephila clavipes]|nr:histone-lysine N-methyltransferase SETMAR [Trichonephila clavipes]